MVAQKIYAYQVKQIQFTTLPGGWWMDTVKIKKSNSTKSMFYNNLPLSTVPPPKDINKTLFNQIDSGSSKHYIHKQDTKIWANQQPTENISVHLLDTSTIQATVKGHLPINHILEIANEVHAFQHLKNSLIMSLGQLCDNGCDILLHKKNISPYLRIHNKFYKDSKTFWMVCGLYAFYHLTIYQILVNLTSAFKKQP